MRFFSADDVKEATIIDDSAPSTEDFFEWLNKDKSSKKVDLPVKKRNAFFKLGYNEHHIPNQKNYEKDRKPRLSQWNDPAFNWPPRMPRPTMHKGRALLNHIDGEERQRIEKGRQFKMPPYRSGDVMEVTYFQTISSGKLNVVKGLVIGKSKPNNLRHSFKIRSVIEDEPTSINFKCFSPLVAKVEISKYGSNQLRKKLNYVEAMDLSKNRL